MHSSYNQSDLFHENHLHSLNNQSDLSLTKHTPSLYNLSDVFHEKHLHRLNNHSDLSLGNHLHSSYNLSDLFHENHLYGLNEQSDLFPTCQQLRVKLSQTLVMHRTDVCSRTMTRIFRPISWTLMNWLMESITRPSAATVVLLHNRWILIFHMEVFQIHAPPHLHLYKTGHDLDQTWPSLYLQMPLHR